MAWYSLFISICAASTATPSPLNRSSISCGIDTIRNPFFFMYNIYNFKYVGETNQMFLHIGDGFI